MANGLVGSSLTTQRLVANIASSAATMGRLSLAAARTKEPPDGSKPHQGENTLTDCRECETAATNYCQHRRAARRPLSLCRGCLLRYTA